MQQMRLTLHSGESIRSPRILQFHWLGSDPMQGCNQFRQVMLAHVLPQRDGRAITPPIAHTSVAFWEENACTESTVLSHLDSIRGLGFDVFWLDAYWIRDGYPKGTGHYGFPIQRVEPKDRFPRGIKPIGEAVHRQDLKFLVWFSPESIWAGGDLGREHPEWTTFWEKDKPLADWGQFDLGIPEAREFMTRYLATVIREYGMDWLRIDSGMIPAFAREKDRKTADRTGMAEIRYFGNFYPLVPVTNRAGDWCVLQYHLPAQDEGMILAFRRHEASAAEMTLSVREIAPTASYEVTQSQGYERLPPVRFQGPALQQMRVAIPERPGSVLIEYRRIGG